MLSWAAFFGIRDFSESDVLKQKGNRIVPDPLVSVIMPAHNASQFIGRSLASAMSQTYAHLEIVVVDDGSTDGTADIVREVANGDPRVRLITQGNRGVAAARNRAISVAGGSYIAPLDADDVWSPRKIERQVACFSSLGPSAGLVYCWWKRLEEFGEVLHASRQWRLTGNVIKPLVVTNFIGNASVPLLRREAVEAVGGYPDHRRECGAQGCEDWDLSLRIAEKYTFGVVPEYLVGYRQHPHSMSRNGVAMSRSFEVLATNLRNRHPDIPAPLLRWSRSGFYWYLAATNYKDDKFGHWLKVAVTADPMLLLSTRVFRVFAKKFLLDRARPLNGSAYRRQRPSPERFDGSLDAEPETEQDGSNSPLPRTFKPYGMLVRSRFSRISGQQL